MFHVKRPGQSAARDLRFLDGSAPPAALGFGRRAGLNQKPVPHPRALLQAADSKSLNMEATRLDRRRAAEPVRRTMFYAPTQSCWPCGGDSGAHWKRDKVRIPGVMFHVKQTSKITAAARPIPPPACHSDAPTRSCCQRRIFALESSSRSFNRKTVFISSVGIGRL